MHRLYDHILVIFQFLTFIFPLNFCDILLFVCGGRALCQCVLADKIGIWLSPKPNIGYWIFGRGWQDQQA